MLVPRCELLLLITLFMFEIVYFKGVAAALLVPGFDKKLLFKLEFRITKLLLLLLLLLLIIFY